MKFISNKNTYEFDSFDYQQSLIALYIHDQYVVFSFVGDVKFFRDANGVGDFWDDYDLTNDFKIEIVHELSDVDLVLSNYVEDYVIEWVVEYDARTINIGFNYAVWKDRFNLIAELNDGKYLSAGLYFKICLK
jgi:hypothetical protein